MVDFEKRLTDKSVTKVTDPIALYENLDRASDKGPLRPVQEYVLEQWHRTRRDEPNTIVKLHTGQGKTLVGLLMLQSKLNEGQGPALYLCPSNFLVDQTCAQAKQFGISVVKAEPDIPPAFINGNKILVASAQKLFNGLTKFGIGPRSTKAGIVLLDDSHACVDTIKQACTIKLSRETNAYARILSLFSSDLQHQGIGTFREIEDGEFDALLPVPYWSWSEQVASVSEILADERDNDQVKFAWPLLRDRLDDCLCLISGFEIEIIPYSCPLSAFGTFANAQQRIFMSATVTDDSFLVKGLRIDKESIESPLTYPNEPWCGEKMLLMPSLLDSTIDHETFVKSFADASAGRKYGVVTLVPSFKKAEIWKEYGAEVADTHSINDKVAKLKEGECDKVLCIANRYDGVDLPDDACRVLIIDSKPLGASLYERFIESCRPSSEVNQQRTVRIIEQGLGRSVRGEKDYCAIVLLGSDLVEAIHSSEYRKFYSEQTQGQIDIGLEVTEMANDDIGVGADTFIVIRNLIKKVLERDSAWKRFYAQSMNEANAVPPSKKMLNLYAQELNAEIKADSQRWRDAASLIQNILDGTELCDEDRGWYLQEMARYAYKYSKGTSKRIQLSAHTTNRYLLKPLDGADVKKLEINSSGRIDSIASWVRKSPRYEDLMIRVDSIVGSLRFGGDSDAFEAGLKKLGECLGFGSERPDKEWGEGPDNLWCLAPNKYLLVECKNKVLKDR